MGRTESSARSRNRAIPAQMQMQTRPYWRLICRIPPIAAAAAFAFVPGTPVTATPTERSTVRLADVHLTASPATHAAARQPALIAQATYPTLSAGSTGESVSRLQALLKLLGFYGGAVDGNYTQATQTAVAQFQAAAGISADGITGPSTWGKLLPSPSDVAATTASAAPPPVATQPPAPSGATASTNPSESAPPSGPPVLRPEATGPAVSQLQRELQALGYYNGDIDGGYGELTQAAVEQFQADQQLVVDGVVGQATWDALSRELEQ